MKERRLFIFVEGNDDERFFRHVIRPLFEPKYQSVELIMYACLKNVRVCKFIKGVSSLGHDFILVADIDEEPSVKSKKKVIRHWFCEVEDNDIMVIIKEIESWYLAGVDDHAASQLGIHPPGRTDQVTKEDFNRKIPHRYTSRVAYMIDILNLFSIRAAKKKNRSFHFFMKKYRLSRPK
jgi:hypothetical protein